MYINLGAVGYALQSSVDLSMNVALAILLLSCYCFKAETIRESRQNEKTVSSIAARQPAVASTTVPNTNETARDTRTKKKVARAVIEKKSLDLDDGTSFDSYDEDGGGKIEHIASSQANVQHYPIRRHQVGSEMDKIQKRVDKATDRRHTLEEAKENVHEAVYRQRKRPKVDLDRESMVDEVASKISSHFDKIREGINEHRAELNMRNKIKESMAKHHINTKIDEMLRMKEPGDFAGEEERESKNKRNTINFNLFVSFWLR